MEPNGSSHEHASTSLKVVLLIFAIVLVGVLTYLVWNQNNQTDTTDYASPTVKTTETATTSETDDRNLITIPKDQGNFQFELPTGYGAYTSSGCEGGCVHTLRVGKFDSSQKSKLSDTPPNIVISISAFDGSSNLLSEFNEKYQGQEIGEVIIGGEKAKEFKDLGLFNQYYARFVKADFGYSLSAQVGGDDFSEARKNEIVQKILSSWKFL